jgi:hypothetical protein
MEKASISAKLVTTAAPRRPLAFKWFRDIDPEKLHEGKRKTVIKGWLDEAALGLIFGPTSCGKTFLALDLALHVAAGWTWGDEKTTAGGVIYVAAEAGTSIEDRIAAFKLRYSILAKRDLPFVAITEPVGLFAARGKQLYSADFIALGESIKAHIEEMKVPLRLIVIDTMNRAFAGADENSSQDMGKVIAALDFLRSKFGCHVLTIHHTGKDQDRGARGHSSLECAVDTAVKVQRDEKSGVSTATIIKQRDGSSGKSKSFRLELVKLGEDEDGDPVTSCVLGWSDAPPAKGDEGKHTAKVLSVLSVIIDREGKDQGSGIRVIEESRWREACTAQLLGVKPDAVRGTYLREMKRLTNPGGSVSKPGPVGFKDGMVWIKPQGELELDEDNPF